MGIDKELIDKLLADCKGPEDLIGEQGLLKQLTKALVERAMNAELTLRFISVLRMKFLSCQITHSEAHLRCRPEAEGALAYLAASKLAFTSNVRTLSIWKAAVKNHAGGFLVPLQAVDFVGSINGRFLGSLNRTTVKTVVYFPSFPRG